MQVIILWSEMPLLHFPLRRTTLYLKLIVRDLALKASSTGSGDLHKTILGKDPEWAPLKYVR